MFSRPAKALRAAWELGSELCTAGDRRGAVHPLHSAMEMFRVLREGVEDVECRAL